MTYEWKETPISVKKVSKFFPVRLCFAISPTFSKVSQQASHGSVFTRAKDKSSFFGLKSVFFCLLNCAASHATMLSVTRCKSEFAPPSILLIVWLLNMTISRRVVTDVLERGMRAILTYCCQRWQIMSTMAIVYREEISGSSFGSRFSSRVISLKVMRVRGSVEKMLCLTFPRTLRDTICPRLLQVHEEEKRHSLD